MDEETGEQISGTVGTSITVEAEGEGRALVTLQVREVIHGPQGRDEDAIILVSTLFKHLFKPGFSRHSLDESSFCIMADVPLEFLREEWGAVVENHPNSGGDYIIERGDAPLPINFPIVVDTDEKG